MIIIINNNNNSSNGYGHYYLFRLKIVIKDMVIIIIIKIKLMKCCKYCLHWFGLYTCHSSSLWDCKEGLRDGGSNKEWLVYFLHAQ